MPIRKLEHYNLATDKLDETVGFYTRLLGMTAGPIPRLDAEAGAWIYDHSGTPVVHLVSIAPNHLAALPEFVRERLTGRQRDAGAGTGAIDHIAFECGDYDEFVVRFREAGTPIRENFVDEIGLRQIFVDDPNGVTLELNFR